MHKDIRLHGQVGSHFEYFIMVAGNDAYQHYFFNIVQEEERLRIFSPGNEFIITPQGVSHRGNGGFFCEDMFGVDHPSSDLAGADIINRLVMYGMRSGDSGTICFSEHTQGDESFENIFFEGNAVCNYYFFVHSNQLSRNLKSQQEELAKSLGKVIERSESVGDERDDALISTMFPLLKNDSAQLFIIKLIDRHHLEYRDLFKGLYSRNKKITDDDFARLAKLAAAYRIDRYQQERMRIDVMYRHPANKRIVDEYRTILLACTSKGEISHLDNARLTRLKTLSVRNKIPGALLYTLDEMFKKGRNLVHCEERDYIAATREVLEGIFLKEIQIESRITREDMLSLIRAKKKAVENRDHSFDQLMLDASKKCDEKIRDGSDPGLLDGFSYIITYLDRFDRVSNFISQLAFMENVRVSEEMLQAISEHKAAFDNLEEGCFEELFLRELFQNAYLGRFGRRKVVTLLEGLTRAETGIGSIAELHGQLQGIDLEEGMSSVLLEHVRDRIRNFYSKFSTRANQEALRREVIGELRSKKLIKGDIPAHLFHETIVTINKEALYIQSLLPQIIAERNAGLREDFLANSGLDRFYVEELEREYVEKNGMSQEELHKIRKGLSQEPIG